MGFFVQLPIDEFEELMDEIKELKKQLAARETVAQELWDESGRVLSLKIILKDLLEFEFPRKSWRQHPHPKGVMLWSQVERIVNG
jgi:NTP pyrophosphatase (non-canonical NTP hydrolase)